MSSIMEVMFSDWFYNEITTPAFNYHTGHLQQDRYKVIGRILVPNKPIERLANMVWNEYVHGRVTLVQRKIGDNTYEYIAQRTKRHGG